jgi:hypothetical protein
MRSRLTKLGAALAVLAALAVGGTTLASASGGGSSPAKTPVADTDNVQDQSGADAADTADQAESESAGSETPGNDGPGGHADEPGNPNADTQQQGEH